MAIKRILVHFGHERLDPNLIESGIALARRHNAQLHGLLVIDSALTTGAVAGRGASYAYVAESITALKEHAAAVGREFERRCAKENLAWQWTCHEGDTLDVLAEYSFCADLTLVCQQESGGLDDAISLYRPDYLPLRSHGPVLILPRTGNRVLSADNILIAWKPDRSCARAVHDALPLLTLASKVTLLTVDPPSDRTIPDTAMGDYLAAHDVPLVVATRESAGSDGVGDVILAAAKELDSDLLVAGAHGHSRLAEFFFGGATHDILRKMHLPVLMSH